MEKKNLGTKPEVYAEKVFTPIKSKAETTQLRNC